MNNADFLQKHTEEVIDIFEKCGSCLPTFSVLDIDGNDTTYLTQFKTALDKRYFNLFMHTKCQNPRIIASVFTFEGWKSNFSEKLNMPNTNCIDRETIVSVVYWTRDNVQEMYEYKPDVNGKFGLVNVFKDDIEGRFTNPFN
jgi:hypothetical protein